MNAFLRRNKTEWGKIRGKEGEPLCHRLAVLGEVCLVYRAEEWRPTRPKLRRVQRIPFGLLLNELRARARVTSLCPAVQVEVACPGPRVKRPIIHPELQVRAAEARVRVSVQGFTSPADASHSSRKVLLCDYELKAAVRQC